MKRFLLIVVAVAIFGSLQGTPSNARTPRKTGFGPGEQDWGWYEARTGAHLFYWLFYTQANVNSFYDRPLVIWLQGGPGASSTGYGNFAEIGPLYVNGTKRPSSWANYVNLMFIDNPVGAGWSYVDSNGAFTTTNEEIGADMVQFLIRFYEAHPDFSSVPLYIFCESYGGKMVVEIAKQLDAAIKANKLNADFRGVGLGDSWISPIDSCLTWAPFLLHTSVVDQEGHDVIAADAQRVQNAVNNGNWEQATNLWGNLEGTVIEEAGNVDFYNILYDVGYFKKNHRSKHETAQEKRYRLFVQRDIDSDISALMNGDVKEALELPSSIDFEGQSGYVFGALSGDFMKPVTSVVEELLDTTDLKVAVFNGQLDLIVDTLGTLQWVDRLDWSGSAGWKRASRNPIVLDGVIEGYVKNNKNLYFYWINRAGHMVPTDNPAAAIELLRRVTEFDK